MHDIKRTLVLFAVIILEGYVVLATELLAIRETIPYVGSGTDTVSIIIAAVLMPLAFGYYKGGSFRSSVKNGVRSSVRRRLLLNVLVSQAILIVGLSYVTINLFFYSLIDMGITNRLVLNTLYSLCFLVLPVYMLGQTIPLISNYFTKEKLSRITGRILFFSTLGSFLGATISTLVLMSTVGVHYTAVFNFLLLALLAVLLSRKGKYEFAFATILLAVVGTAMNTDSVMKSMNVVSNNKYNTVMVIVDKDNGDRHMSLNHMASSMYNDNGRKHIYIEALERQIVDPIRTANPPKDILVIGAGAFTFGLEDKNNTYEYVDIDSSLKDIAEKSIIKQELSSNKKFIPMEARAFLMSTKKKYDAIIIDIYLGGITMPEHLVTQEFYRQIREHLKDNGIVAANFIESGNFTSALSRHMDDTFRSVFPYVSRYALKDDYDLWNDSPSKLANILYFYRHHPEETDRDIYTDNRNRLFLDKPQTK